MKKYVFILAFMVYYAIFGSMIRSAMGARLQNIVSQESPSCTATDYVQDGLVVLFDAIENIGWNMHDSNATSWINLVDSMSYNIIARSTADYAWTSNAFIRNQASFGYIIADYSDKLQQPIRAGIFTFEIVTSSPIQSANWQAQIINICQSSEASTYNKGIVAVARREDTGLIQYLSIGKYWKPGMDISLDSASILATIAFSYDGSSIAAYANGKLFKSASFTNDMSIEGTIIRLGSTTYAFRGSYHCIRVYSRPLTAKEVAHNYLVDKMRFGL